MNVLAIGAHPDDVEIACSGTLAKCVKRGDKVIVCHASTGNLGHVVIPPDELTKIRAEEAKKAAEAARKKAEEEEKAARRVSDQVNGYADQVRYAQLKARGLSREAEIQKALDQARKAKGSDLTPQEIQRISAAAGAAGSR